MAALERFPERPFHDCRPTTNRAERQVSNELPAVQTHLFLAAVTAESAQRTHCTHGLVDEIRRATNGNFVLGNERFADEIATALGRRVIPGRS